VRVLRPSCWLLLAGLTPLLHGADQTWFTRAWLTDDGLPNNHVTAIAQAPGGELVVATRVGTASFDGVHFTSTQPLATDPDVFRSLRATTTSGEVWVVRESNVGLLHDGKFDPVLVRRDPRIAAARDGGLWIASDGVLVKRMPDGGLRECGKIDTVTSRPHVLALMEDHAGAVWIGTATNGLFRYDGDAFQKIETSYSYILCLAEDADGNIWVGTDGGGLNRVTKPFISLERYSDGDSSVGIQSVAEDAANQLWGVTQNRWLVRREDKRWLRVKDDGLAAVDAPLCIAADRDGAIWIGTARRMFFCWQAGRLTRWGETEGYAAISAHCFLPTSNGDLWIGEYHPDGVQRLRAGVLAPAIPTAKVRAMCEDRVGNVWIGTQSSLLVVRRGEEKFTDVPLPGGSAGTAVMSIVATSDGAVWAGCAGGGLVCVRDGRAVRIGPEQGLPDAYISQMVDDQLGCLWIGSANHGIFKVRFDQLERALRDPGFSLRAIVYGRNEGLSYLEAYGAHSPDAIGPGSLRTHDGQIWIPMRTAIAFAQPGLLREDIRPPPVRLTRVSVDGATLTAARGVSPDHRRIDFEFSVLNLSTPDNAHVRYRLDGIDTSWIEAGAQRVATYSRLTSGRYRFQLQSANFDGPWTDASETAELIVRPFYWQTWWFRVGALVLISAIVAAVVHQVSTRRMRLKHRLLEQQSALDRERARIARDLHDDLGGSLTQVTMMLDLAQKDTAADSQSKLGRCVTLVRGAAQSVDEIIWAINPRNDTLRYLIDYLSQFVVEYLHAANIECSVELPDTIPDRAVTPEMRHHLLLAVKECVTNVVRHAQATEVRLHIDADDAEFTLLLEDNGVGFTATPDNSTADGLRNIRDRMTEIGGAFEIESRRGTGTRLRLIYRWPCP
jgi:signal transduction histidine kinase/ligand-binding sensor domain-containing protein